MQIHFAECMTSVTIAMNDIAHMNHVLGACSDVRWFFKRVRKQMDQWELNNNQKKNKKDSKENSTNPRVTLLYVRGVPEALNWVFWVVYQIPCKDCPCVYTEETDKGMG